MKLRQHRADLKFFARFTAHSQVDDNGCITCAAIKRYRRLLSWAEAVLDESEWVSVSTMERRERKVVKDSK